MKHPFVFRASLLLLQFALVGTAVAQNPIIRDQFSADPTARVFNGKIYLYPSHDIPTPADKPNLRKDWFCMADYHVFSSENLTDWKDHGLLVDQKQVPWVDGERYAMWAPDCVEKNGKYYFYFPADAKRDSTRRGGSTVGVGVADKPEGPFRFEPKPIPGVGGIDPCVLIDPKDGQAYIYWVAGGLSVAKLKDNMMELASERKTIENLPNGFKEGPFVFERNGKYYLTFPYVKNKTEQLVWCIGDSPMGPFRYGGVIMEESPTGCWTNHHSIVQYKGQWYLFYHHNDYSPNFDKNRSVRADSLFFEADGSIRTVVPTWRGIGVTDAAANIQIDRYTAISKEGTSVQFLDTMNRFQGWKTIFSKNGAWIRYNAVHFNGQSKKVQALVRAQKGGTLQIRLDKADGPVAATVVLSPNAGWKTVEGLVKPIKAGNHDLFVAFQGNAPVEVDWVTFR
jgi:hypothetical protein